MLALNNVSKSYGRHSHRVHVLRDISLGVGAGETVWLRGDSGSGKSSLIRVAGLLSTPDSGNVRVADVDISHAEPLHDVRRDKIGIVFQHGNLLPDLTVSDNVAIAARFTSRQEILHLLEALGLGAIADRPAKQISGGEAQRVACCRALVNDPVLLLFDEPTSGLDAKNAALVREALDVSRARGRAILIASHDPATEAIADRVINMRDGSLV